MTATTWIDEETAVRWVLQEGVRRGVLQQVSSASSCQLVPSSSDQYLAVAETLFGRTDDLSALRRAYRQLAVRVHPDKNAHSAAHQAFQLVQAAYEAAAQAALGGAQAMTQVSSAQNTPASPPPPPPPRPPPPPPPAFFHNTAANRAAATTAMPFTSPVPPPPPAEAIFSALLPRRPVQTAAPESTRAPIHTLPNLSSSSSLAEEDEGVEWRAESLFHTGRGAPLTSPPPPPNLWHYAAAPSSPSMTDATTEQGSHTRASGVSTAPMLSGHRPYATVPSGLRQPTIQRSGVGGYMAYNNRAQDETHRYGGASSAASAVVGAQRCACGIALRGQCFLCE